ncbi:hypothetical protein NDU88_002891 [Pleurodeles waltl]|uniref:Uncharacterized protein n=1 Tax=Pleurodeles waltl TaxID=8319 RepID=A0AAV7VBV3_PLEWA|nr:hypothetical protein NDU88_002891 [Pleurodeles waltl]
MTQAQWCHVSFTALCVLTHQPSPGIATVSKEAANASQACGAESHVLQVTQMGAPLYSFLGVKCQLRQAGLIYMLLILAKIKLIAGGRSYFFTEPADAWDWVEQHRYESFVPSSPMHQSSPTLHKHHSIHTSRHFRSALAQEAPEVSVATALWTDWRAHRPRVRTPGPVNLQAASH